MSRILIVEDEPDLRTLIEYNLQEAGYDTESVGSGLAAQRIISSRRPDLVILDLMLPDLPGTEICREIRRNEETKSIPVLMLTAKGEESNRIYGFEVGADDYIVKPASMRELVLRVGALLRRSSGGDEGTAAAGPKADDPNVRRVGEVTLYIKEHRAVVGDQSIDLTELEARLLDLLLSRAGRVQSRETLLEEVWPEEEVSPRTVDMRIKRLRSRLGDAGKRIESVRGLGYRFERTEG